MKKKLAILSVVVLLIIVFLMLRPSSYPPMTGTVVDAVTRQPIEGAVVLVEWTKTHGIGEHWTESFKVEEAVTDKDGKFTVAGLDTRSVNSPDVTVYKKEYVAWSNRWLFPSYENRPDFRWGKGYVFKLEKFKDTYSYVDHDGFISRSINDTIGWESKKLFMKIYYDSEESLIIRERSARDKKRHGGSNQ
jgi:hypothetical protein